MVPAVTCRIDKETARNTLRKFALQTLSSFVQATVLFLGIAVLKLGEGW